MNNQQLFRQALQRQNDRAAGMKMPDDMEQRVMKRIAQREVRLRHRSVWLFSTIGAVAASLLLLLTMHINKVEQETPSAHHLPAINNKVAPEEVLSSSPSSLAAVADEDMRAPAMPQTTRRKVKKKPRRELPDTLGNGIWHSKENVLLAIEMLSECEKTIERSEQRIRNDIVEATYHATPQPANAQLVVYDNGDYVIVEDNQPAIIEL